MKGGNKLILEVKRLKINRIAQRKKGGTPKKDVSLYKYELQDYFPKLYKMNE